MAYLGHLGPLRLLWPMGHNHGPRPQGQVGPKPQLDPPEPILATNLAINPSGPKFGHRPSGTTFHPLASGDPQRPPDQLSHPFPQLKGNSFHSSMHPVLKVAGVVHIWYYIPLYTIFAQQFHGDVFRTKYNNSKSRSRNPTPISKVDLSTHQSGNQKIIQGSQPPGPAGVGLAISFRIIPRAFSEVIQFFNQL
ncbi:hypothetical protein O181_018699 [Austropuccinia psidii MF-1]|uniref:Uncharacterized protein n=1 Tax=Austropuccinia psidii MF-1 TaxID=1389203 RepID=A0A9Q3C862_9BASI|nr:hypothetical protein [Austropuccinia psidii MF-1]